MVIILTHLAVFLLEISNDLLIQWGRNAFTTRDSIKMVYFPITFAIAALSYTPIVNITNYFDQSSGNTSAPNIQSLNQGWFKVYSANAIDGRYFFWNAIGKASTD